jgi:crossover junction endodeoxyribonuclease RuvC
MPKKAQHATARPPAKRVLGIDASLRSTGAAVVEASGSRLVPVRQETLRAPARCPRSECLARLQTGIADVIAGTQPTAAAIEGTFYCKNVRTAFTLGEARGAALAACAAAGLPVYEYAPRRVKQAVVGYGAAGKEQVRRMVMSLLGLREEPQEDAADALAIAICHLHNEGRLGLPEPTRI